ncbi:hypothetical protein GCM10010211_41510 [Streptomyces albospinus]|uniref:Uncharacterized protein n=1 Tax=Streptomyces albospinus TaxID=285515 RepID=A0ABQ2V7D8_9ACTN|nr:hypothetical protein GCM10010211_41510 [Streptomyces albospinus]
MLMAAVREHGFRAYRPADHGAAGSHPAAVGGAVVGGAVVAPVRRRGPVAGRAT